MATSKIPTAAELIKATEAAQKRSEDYLTRVANLTADGEKRDIAAHRAKAVRIIEKYLELSIAEEVRRGHRKTYVWSLDWGILNGKPSIAHEARGSVLENDKDMSIHVVEAALVLVKARLAKKGLTSLLTANKQQGGMPVIVSGDVLW